MSRLLRFLIDDRATTSVEYAVLLAMILMCVIGAVAAVGQGTGGLWGGTQTKLHNAGFGQ
jgi:Flp pilus assembly pilin Flp